MTERSAARGAEARRTAWRAMGVVVALYAALVATHEGEFWPFSIYPMFSQAAKPWTRSVLYELEPEQIGRLRWEPQQLEELPGVAFAAADHGIEVIDLAKFVSLSNRQWDDARVDGLKKMLGEHAGRSLVVYEVSGKIVVAGAEPAEPRIALAYEPVVALVGGAARRPPER